MVASAFTAVVLVTGLPVHALLQQRADEASTTATVNRLVRQNRFLASQAAALSNPSTVRSLAHSEFDYIQPGQKAYDVVPPAGGSGSVAGIGHVQLGQPVVAPGSAASALAIGALGGPSPGAGSGTGGSSGAPAPGGQAAPGGSSGSARSFLARLVHTLEFWS
ncbi:MAG: septum formation initiator family protein [Actinomycetota bacterium]|nr:septum formation initiator family protein [Actinomycetota bacterium]